MCLGDLHAIHVADFMALFHDGEQHWRRWGCLVGDAVRDRGLPVLAVARLQHEALIAGTAVNAQREPIVPEPDVQGKFELRKIRACEATQVFVNSTWPVGEIGLDPCARGCEIKAAVALGDLGCQVHQPIGVRLDRVLRIEHAMSPQRACSRQTQNATSKTMEFRRKRRRSIGDQRGVEPNRPNHPRVYIIAGDR